IDSIVLRLASTKFVIKELARKKSAADAAAFSVRADRDPAVAPALDTLFDLDTMLAGSPSDQGQALLFACRLDIRSRKKEVLDRAKSARQMIQWQAITAIGQSS